MRVRTLAAAGLTILCLSTSIALRAEEKKPAPTPKTSGKVNLQDLSLVAHKSKPTPTPTPSAPVKTPAPDSH